MPEIHIDFSEIMGTVAGVLLEPYATFIARLHADARITDAEVQQLQDEFRAQSERLSELVQARLGSPANEGAANG